MPKKVLFTGGSGFIGRNAIPILSGIFELSSPSSRELDLTSKPSVERYLRENAFDAVVHAAGSSVYGEAGSAEAAAHSLLMFRNVASCSKHYGRLIQLGSGAEYDKSRPLIRVREEEWGVMVPHDSYGRYKYECSKEIEKMENGVCLRIFGCYGKHEDYSSRFISNAICRSIFGMPIVIANRNVVFSYLYAEDLARLLVHFVGNSCEHRHYNAVPDEIADLLSIACIVNSACASSLPIEVKNTGMGNEYTGDNSRLRAELPAFRFTPLGEGIAKLADWYFENREKIDKSRL